jgi:hypothetical protein
VLNDKKWTHGFKRFNLWGIDNPVIESGLLYSMHCIKKIYVYTMRNWEKYKRLDLIPKLEMN